MKEIIENTKKCLWNRSLNTVKLSGQPKAIYIFNVIGTIPKTFSTKLEKKNHKIHL